MKTVSLRKQTSKLVLAVALATGMAMVAGHIAPGEAQAQRAKSKKKKKKGEENAAEYSSEWRAVFVPLNESLSAEGVDTSAYRPQIEQLVGQTPSGDEKLQTGQLIYNAGLASFNLAQTDEAKTAAQAERLRGMELMIESGKAPIAATGQYNFIAYQLASVAGQHAKSREYLKTATGLGFTGGQTPAQLKLALAQT